ncbi:MAG: carboxypeptidase M32, partial [Rubrobacter sp.]|nr:carboxypeptidase M32 [Rubrobacter sp.]
AAGILSWDRQTKMPEGGLEARADQLSTLSTVAHEMTVDGHTEALISAAEDETSSEQDSEDAALVRLARRDYEKSARLPARLVSELSRRTALAESAWAQAREESQWKTFAPHLQGVLELSREAAEHLGYEEHPYDALADTYERGATKSGLEKMFDELKSGIVPLLREVYQSPAAAENDARQSPLIQGFDQESQERFGKRVITRLGYDWMCGRQDLAVHPFCIGFSPGDVRITTRFDENWLSGALFGTIHEAGHAMYEQGVDPAYTRTPLSGGVSMGVHESQSRLWENLVGRSRPFWDHFYPELQQTFPQALGNVDLESFYRAINVARPSEIRVEADELTYNLHILLRFELETALLDQKLSVEDIPDAWNAKMEEYLGITPENVSRGALQDVHWSAGLIGYFPTYAIGNVLSVQLFEAAKEDRPEIPEQIGRGEFSALLGWLRENVHRYGSRYTPEELVQRAAGKPLDTAPYLRYLREKFTALYDL